MYKCTCTKSIYLSTQTAPVLIQHYPVSNVAHPSNNVFLCSSDLYSDLGPFHRSSVRDAVLVLWWVQLLVVVFDPVRDAQEDAQLMQTVHVPWVRLGDHDQDLFRLGLAQDTGERLQKHLEVTFASFIMMPFRHFDIQSNCCKNK